MPVTSAFLTKLLRSHIDAQDRADIFTEAAGTATNTGIAYWLVLGLAGAIAALGLALNSSAVIIGAMLIAPLLGPVVGLGLALAIGDGRLAVEVAFVVLVSTCAVILVGALLAIALPVPFQTVTSEIAARTRPTTLDLVIAVASGLAGAAVTVARRSRLSGVVPGVAVAVALVPPLAVTGYGIGTGWNWPIIRGSLLLYGANLAGIVMSGMTVFLIVGMHGPEVLGVVESWHRQRRLTAIKKWIERTPGLRSLGIMRSTWARLGLVIAFVALVGIPLRESLKQIARESRVQRAVDAAARLFQQPGRSFVINRDVQFGHDATRVELNVATTDWFTDSLTKLFERRASAAAGEPISLALNQLPTSAGGDLTHLAELLSIGKPSVPATPAVAAPPAARIAALRSTVGDAIAQLTLPDSVAVIDYQLVIGNRASDAAINLLYAASQPLATQSTEMIQRQLLHALGLSGIPVHHTVLSTAPVRVRVEDVSLIDSLASLSQRYPRIRVEVQAGARAPQRSVDSVVALFRRRGATDSTNLTILRSGSGQSMTARILAR